MPACEYTYVCESVTIAMNYFGLSHPDVNLE